MDKDSIALVTGAAHRLGRIFALTLAQNGYAILLHYHRSAEAAFNTAAEIRALGARVYPVEADLTDSEQIQALFSKIDSLNLPMKVLINSAASMKHENLRSVSAEDWDSALNLNLRAPFLISQRAAERMKEGGVIVNVTDAGVWKTWTGFPAYLVSKSGLEMLTRLQAKAYAPNIRVNAIAPGLVLPSSDTKDEEWEKLISHLPLKHPASNDELASALEFLLHNQSITGQTIFVDGGYSLT
ncbi:MAG: SDR family oxidoreductase [Anaerolineales bacterium]|jgi:NAD(P)-dependent dehydrogenase (short-subunit alcohol dehydrogenase family)